jgi:uncharacterized protein YdbL (DUF1318 family)
MNQEYNSEEQDSFFSELAKSIFKEAELQAMQTQGRVLKAIDGWLVWVYKDGTVVFLKRINAPVRVKEGLKIKLKR